MKEEESLHHSIPPEGGRADNTKLDTGTAYELSKHRGKCSVTDYEGSIREVEIPLA